MGFLNINSGPYEQRPQHGTRVNFLGVPLLDPGRKDSSRDHRADARFVCKGTVILRQQGVGALEGRLLDISANGFRVSFTHPAPTAGTEVEFNHQFFHGRAQFMWIVQRDNCYEAGCMVLRD